MRDQIKKLKERAAQTVATARQVLEAAEKDGRSLTQEEAGKYDAIMADVSDMKRTIDRLERQLELEAELSQPTREPIRPEPGEGRRGVDLAGLRPEVRRIAGAYGAEHPRLQPAFGEAFRKYLLGGWQALADAEARALQADDPAAGGFAVAPIEFVADLIKKVDDALFIRRLATVRQLRQAASLGAPALDADPDDADWTTELGTGNEDSAMKFGRRELKPNPLAKRIKVSNKLIRIGAMDIEDLVRDRLAYKFGVAEEKGFLTGDGAGKPLGLFTASAQGISTARDVSTGNTTTSIGADGLLEAKYVLKQQYQRLAQWLFHRDAVKQIAKLKDGNGQYLWQQSLMAGQPDRLSGLPVNMSEFAPNTFTTGKYVGLIGDFSAYWIAEALDMSVQRLAELYAEKDQTGFIGRMEVDGQPVLEEAFARVKLA